LYKCIIYFITTTTTTVQVSHKFDFFTGRDFNYKQMLWAISSSPPLCPRFPALVDPPLPAVRLNVSEH